MTMASLLFSLEQATGHGDHGNMITRHLMQENKKLQDQVNEGRKKIQTLAKQLSVASADVAKSVKSVADYDVLEAKFLKCTSERDAVQAALEDSRKDNDEMKQMVAKLQQQVEDMGKAHKAEQADTKEKMEALKNLLQKVSTQVTETKSSKEAVESKLKETQKIVVGWEEKAIVANQNQKRLQQELKIMSSEKAELNKKISVLGANIQANEHHRKQLETKIAGLAYEKQALERNIEKAKMEYKKVVATNDSLVKVSTQRDKTIKEQRMAIQKLEEEKAREIAQLKRVTNKLDMVSHSHDQALAEIDRLKLFLKETQQEMTEKDTESQKRQDDLQNQIAKLDENKASLEHDLKERSAECEAARKEISELKNIIENRDQQIKEEKEKLASLGCSEKIQVLNNDGKIASFTESYF